MSMTTLPPLPYNPDALPREKARHYIPATAQEIQAMLQALGLARLDDLFAHIPAAVRLPEPLMLPEELPYEALYRHVLEQSQKNHLPSLSFLGDALPYYTVPDLVPYVASLRELMTAYTPYQPERSQGTLLTQWLYQSCLAMLTGLLFSTISGTTGNPAGTIT